MATYKQKLPRVHHVPSDTEELSGSEQEWVVFEPSNKPIERRLVNNVSDEEDWHVVGDTSPVEVVTPPLESNSELASGCSEYDSESYFVQDSSVELPPEVQDNSQTFIRNMPSHDGTGNFYDTKLSDGSNYDTSTNHSDQDNESLSSDMNEPVISDETSQNQRKSHRESWITKLYNVFRIEIEDEAVSAISSQEHTIQIYHKFAESISSAARFELGDLGNINPIIAYSNIGDENANSSPYTTVTTRFGSRLIVPKDPMSINFAPTISEDMLKEMMATENVNSTDHQNQQSDNNSLLSMIWTTICRITNNFIPSDDPDSVPNDPSYSNLTFASHTHRTGLASIITGDNPLHNYKNHYSSSSTPSSPSYNAAQIFLTPVSSSTSLNSFTSRAGSDCGLESGGGIGKSTTIGATLVL